MAALTVATIAGNAGVVSALWRARRSPQHYPLASLAAADLLVGVSVLPLAAARELFTFRLSFITCACWSTLDVLCCTASILSLCALGWERYRGITDPLSRADRAKKAKLLAVLVWPAAAAVALPTAFVKTDSVSTNERDKACTVNTNPSYVFFSVTFSFYIPTCIMLVQYGLVIRALALRPPIRAHRGQGPIVEMDEMKCPESSQQTDESGRATETGYYHYHSSHVPVPNMLDSVFHHVTNRFPLRLRTRLHVAMEYLARIYQFCPQPGRVRRSRRQGSSGVPGTAQEVKMTNLS
ncbi:5-hydroxytryptamine receptor 1D-like isoform X1 [Cydia pomonella]|uniref:5-hydroxytryptamine receptor 1D-like isoform X1 n=1 Tax=Cydia pomonella TaxID=82600 RepID=UPI002ADE3BC2|nr:5-hydroxytryptamine receptor 1D-like isoform X1 [Cydia pomonella]